MNPYLIQILEFVLSMLKDCPEPANKFTKRIAALRNPGPIHKLRLWMKAKRSGMTVAQYTEGMEELEVLRKDATDDDLKDFINLGVAGLEQ